MAIVLKGAQPEIKLQLTAKMPDCEDSFVAVFKRGSKAAFQNALEQAKANKLKDDEFLAEWLIGVESLIDAETGESGNYSANDILPVMMPHMPYVKALVKGAWIAIGNEQEAESQRLGN